MKNNLKFKIYLTLFSCFTIFIFLCPIKIKAAILSFEIKQNEYNINDVFVVDIKIDSQGEYINVIKNNIKFDQDMIQVQNFSNGNSVLAVWIENPEYSNDSGEISFAGGIPNGFDGNNGLIGKIIFRAVKEGQTEIKFLNNSKILLNNGLGTEVNLITNKINLNINKQKQKVINNEWQKNIKKDIISPESFKIYINKDEKIFNNKYFLTFSTTDKQTGINYYEVKESNNIWKKTNSPYLLKNQNNQEIKVKAIDKAGNERIEIVNFEFSSKSINLKPKLNIAIYIFVFVIFIFLCYILIKLAVKLIVKKIN